MQFGVFELYERVGIIEIVQNGLYYDYSAKIHKCRETFVKLYCHNRRDCVPLGVFAPSDGGFLCRGRISVRQLGEIDNDTGFSTRPEAWKKGVKSVGDLHLPPKALLLEEDSGYAIAAARYDVFPAELLPYFCFITAANLGGVPCLILRADKQGRPIVQSSGDTLGT